jgi:hypothetical protein
MNHTRYTLTLEFASLPTDPGGIRALRRCLKRLLRSYGARCVDCRPVAPVREPNPDGEYSYRFAPAAPAKSTTDHNTVAGTPCQSRQPV